MLVALFAITMFTSAMLLFVVQPMVAKLLLPELGGSSAVWTTCMLFFQGMLLLGYAYSHAGARWLTPRKQVLLHIPLMLIAGATLPIAIPELGIDASAQPNLWLIAALLFAVGLPFFVVSTTAPLLQHFFAHTDHPAASDPYFLYAASNVGSMVALLGYPFMVEPVAGVRAQTLGWSAVYGAFVLLMVACSTRVFSIRESRARPTDAPSSEISWAQRARWVLLAAVPSSLMLGLTQYMTTDVAAVPLLWVLPLALYLLTFILVFASRPVWLPNIARSALPVFAALVFTATAFKVELWISVMLHLLNFFLFTMFFHGTLAEERPGVDRLTEFFLLVSVGGVLGGLFNALIAPMLFDRAVDYHLVMFAAIACIKPSDWRLETMLRNPWPVPVLVSGVGALYLYAQGFWELTDTTGLILASVLVASYVVVGGMRARFENAAFAVILAAGAHAAMATEGLITYERSFFAAYKVYERDYKVAGKFRKFSHGTTVHGAQSLDPNKASIPVSYHHPDGPVGQVLEGIAHENVLVVGLGAGAMASYARPETHFDILEIDPLVEEIAREYFTYLDICGESCAVQLGDGRRLIEESDKKWDIIFLDAYNSDAVPTHLLTSEALELYFDHLNPKGVIVFHVSNRYLDIEGVVATIAEDGGYPAYTQFHSPPRRVRREQHIDRSKYTVVARTKADLEPLLVSKNWRKARSADVHWTDDFSNVVDVIKW